MAVTQLPPMALAAVSDDGAAQGILRRQALRESAARTYARALQTGVGRTGAFWAVDHGGVVPDVMVLSKAIGGGLPLAVVVYHEDLDVWPPGAHAGTFRGNQLAMAAGAATLAHVRENNLAERAATVGARMLDRLRQFATGRRWTGDVRGRGLMIGLELVDPEAGPAGEAGNATPARAAALPADPGLAAAVQQECLGRGLIVELGGRHGAVIRLLPPLTITDEQTEAVLDRLTDALDAAIRTPGARSRELPLPAAPFAPPLAGDHR